MQVFLVDDSPVVLTRLSSVLVEISGIEIVGEAENASDALLKIESLKPDVVILDINLPDDSGIKVLQKLKQRHTSPKVIMFTNFPYEQYREESMKVGADYFFDKSKDLEKVIAVLEQLGKGRTS